MTGRRGILWLVAGVALALLGGRWLAGLYGDWAFHQALGSGALWRSQMVTTTLVRGAIFVLTFGFVFANLFAVRQSIVSLVLPRKLGDLEIGEAIPTRRLTLIAFGGATAVALSLSLVNVDWTVARLAFAGAPFAEFDPYLERDLGFFVHWLPFERIWNQLVGALVLLTVILVLVLYSLTPSIRWDERGLYVSTWVRRHLGVLGGVVIVLVSWSWRLDRFLLLTEGGTATSWIETPHYFSAFDHRVLLPYLVIGAFAALPAALVFAWAVWRDYLRTAFGLITALLIAGPVMRLLLPAVASSGGTEEVTAARERPYLATRALYSRRAFSVDAIARPETLQLSVLEPAALARQVTSWDPAALMRFVRLDRRGTEVAAFAWQGGPSGIQAILLREAGDGTQPGTPWPVDRLAAAAVDATGTPSPGPPSAGRGIGGVLVHPGAARYAIVGDTGGRLAAPSFEGSLDRLAHAWDQQNPRLLGAEPPALRPRIVVHRDVRDRLSRVAPFFVAGPTITPLVRGDSLYWIAELFVVAHDYPLTERISFEGRTARYVRHAATAIVQAQTGRVVLIPVETPDPVARTWMRLYPLLFTERTYIPEWMRVALPPAIDWAAVQGTVLGRTGFRADTIAVRTLARVDDADADLTPGPASLFQIDDAGTLAWSVAVVDRADQVTGLLVARGGIHPRTEFHPAAGGLRWTRTLELLQASADSAGFGRELPHSRRGRVQVLPTSSGLLFTQSFYEWAADGPPRLAGVVVIGPDGASVGRSLSAALGYRDDTVMRGVSTEIFRMRVAALYDAMGAALRTGNWRAYGDAWAALGRLLGRPTQ